MMNELTSAGGKGGAWVGGTQGGDHARLWALPDSCLSLKPVYAPLSHCHHLLSPGPISLLLLRDSSCNSATANQIALFPWAKPSSGFHHE